MKVKVSERAGCVTLEPLSAKIISPSPGWQLGRCYTECCVTRPGLDAMVSCLSPDSDSADHHMTPGDM